MKRIRQALARMGGKSSKPSGVPERVQQGHPDQLLRENSLRNASTDGGGLAPGRPGGGPPSTAASSNAGAAHRRSLAFDADPNGVGALILYDGSRASTSNSGTSGTSDKPDKGIDVVFVHSAGGSRIRTWQTPDGVCWPRDLLPRELPNTRIISLGWKVPESMETTSFVQLCYQIGDQLATDLAKIGGESERDLIFVCHGMGGLIIKDALSTTAVSQVFGKRSELGSIYPRTVGAIFLGTPHRGFGRQTLADVAALAAQLDAGGAMPQGHPFMRTILESNDLLETQRGEFVLVSRDLQVVCVREQLGTGALIMPKNSATYDGMNVTTDDVYKDHAGLAKFTDRQDPGYFQLVGHISKLTRRTRFQDTEAGMIRNQEILDALYFDMREKENKADDAYKQTSAWILSAKDSNSENEGGAFDNWLTDMSSPVFWISGNPGSGKTTLVRHAFHDPATRKRLERWAGRNGLVTAAIFLFEAGSYVQKSREGILRGVLYQILSQKPEFIPVCFPSFMNGPWPPPVPFNTTVNLSQAFYQLFARMSKTLRLCLFIDGLDEYRLAEGAQQQQEDPRNLQSTEGSSTAASDRGSEHLSIDERGGEILGSTKWLNDSHTEIARLIMDLSNQEHVKLCVSSRELPPFEEAFRGLPRLRVHTQTEKLISQYCADRLDKVAPGLSSGQRPLCDEVARKSRGDILWARLAIDMLMEGSLRRLRATLDSLPAQLGGPNGLYMRIIMSLTPEQQAEACRIFHLILRACDPPNLVTLAFSDEGYLAPAKLQLADPTLGRLLVEHHRAYPMSRDDLANISDRMQSRLELTCAGLLEATNGGKQVVFMHLTAKEFVLRSSVWKKILTTPMPPQMELDLSLMSGTIRYLKCCATLRLVVTNRPRLQITPEAWLLVSHVLRYAGRVDDNKNLPTDVYAALLDDLDRTCQEAWHQAIKEHVPAPDDVGWYRDKYRPLMASHWTDYEPMELGPSPRRQGFMGLAVQAGLVKYVSLKLASLPDGHTRAKAAQDLLELAVSPEHDTRTPEGGPSVSAAGTVTGTYKDFHHDMPDGRFVSLLLETWNAPGERRSEDDATRRFIWAQALKAGRLYFVAGQRGGLAVLNLTPESTTSLGKNRSRWVASIKALLASGAVDPHLAVPTSEAGGELKSAVDVIKETLEGEAEFARDLILIEALIVECAMAGRAK